MTTQPLLPSSSSFLPLLITPTQLPSIGSIQNTALHNIPTPTAVTLPENLEQDIALHAAVAAATKELAPEQ